MICGLSRESTKAHICRAALEAQGYQTLDLMAAMEDDGGHAPGVIRADGGLVANEFMCQFLADMLGRPLEVPKVAETTAWGAAVLAGVHAGVFADLAAAGQGWRAEKRYEPLMAADERARLYAGWTRAVGMVLGAE